MDHVVSQELERKDGMQNLKKKKKNLFIWLHQVLVAPHGISLVAACEI